MISTRLCGENGTFTLELEGHAAYAEPGQDLVCAAVSTLVFALESYLDGLDKEGSLKKREKSVLESGRARINAVPKAKAADRLCGAFELIYCFLTLLEEYYPENIKISR